MTQPSYRSRLIIARARAVDLSGFQNFKVADEYLNLLRKISALEQTATGSCTFTETAARYLFKLTAYKDEYEVARLLTLTNDTERALEDVSGGKKLTYRLRILLCFARLAANRKLVSRRVAIGH